MLGMNAQTGQALTDIAHLKQSIYNIITTPIGSRVMRRDYGSTLHLLYDKPMDELLVAEMQAAIINALAIHEPRFVVQLVNIAVQSDPSEQGNLLISIEGLYLETNQMIKLEELSV